MEVTNESNPKSLGLCQQKTTEKFYFISDFIGPIGWNFSLFDSDEVQQNSWNDLYKSLNTSFSIKKIENGQTFKLSDLASVSKIKGLENVSPELETIAKLKDKEAVSGEQSVERDDLSAADKNLVSLTALEDSAKDVTFTSSAFNLKEGRHLQKGDSKKILIHEELAKKNGLSLHDKIRLDAGQSEAGKGQTVEFEIVGIFSGKNKRSSQACLLTSVKTKSLQTMKVAKAFWEMVNL